MKSKIKFLILKILNKTIRLYAVKHMEISQETNSSDFIMQIKRKRAQTTSCPILRPQFLSVSQIPYLLSHP